MVAERVIDDFLQLGVQLEHEIVAGHRRCARQRAHGAPAGIDFDLLDARGAVQMLLIALLKADLADVVGAAIVCVDAIVFQLVELALIDAPDVADDVREEFALRILAEQPRVHLDAAESGSGWRQSARFPRRRAGCGSAGFRSSCFPPAVSRSGGGRAA